MIVADQLRKTFTQRGRQLVAVDSVSLTIPPGEIYGLLGPNGAGKTTTLRMLLGLLPPTSGDALIHGVSVVSDPHGVKRAIGLVSTSAGLYPWHSVYELLFFFATTYGVPNAQIETRIQDLANAFSLHNFLHQRCSTLSTGQKQRVVLARALIHDPPVVLLDEPTRGLDVVGTRAVFEYVEELRRRQKAVIVCTHRLDEAERLCDRFGLLHYGKLRAEGCLAELQAATGCARLAEMFYAFADESKENPHDPRESAVAP